jgi:hypothetical protein
MTPAHADRVVVEREPAASPRLTLLEGDDSATAASIRGELALDATLGFVAYLYGSLPFVYALGRLGRVDLRQRGSGNVGATNLWSATGNQRALIGWLGDASKGFLPPLLLRLAGRSRSMRQMGGVCGAAGQCWPLFLGLSGGRGISAFVGAAFWMNPLAWAASLMPMIAGSLWHALPLLGRRKQRIRRDLRRSRGKAVPLGCFMGVALFPFLYTLFAPPGRKGSPAPWLLSSVILLRRLTARLPDDATHGPAVRPQALVYRLLFDRNTSA